MSHEFNERIINKITCFAGSLSRMRDDVTNAAIAMDDLAFALKKDERLKEERKASQLINQALKNNAVD